MRILWLAPIAYGQGSGIKMPPWIETLALSLVKRGDVKLTILNYHATLDQKSTTENVNGIECVFLKTPVPKKDFIQLYRKRIKVINEYIKNRASEFDLVHIHGTEHQYESSLTKVGLPVVLSMQGVMKECIKALDNRFSYLYLSWKMAAVFEKMNIAKINNFICRTHFDRSFVEESNPKANIFCNWEIIRPAFYQASKILNYSNTLLFAGGTHPIKGLDLVLMALDRLNHTSPFTFRLKIIGNAKPEEVQKIIVKHKLKYISLNHIDILGFVNARKIVNIYKSVFCLIHPSRVDNSPNTVCEAQVAGLPVIASDVGGLRSLINHNETGILSPLNHEALASEVIRLKTNHLLWEKISVNAMTVAKPRHDSGSITRKTVAIYKKLITDKKDEPALSDISII